MYRGIITSDPAIMMGKPVIAGTRITVELILEKLAVRKKLPARNFEFSHPVDKIHLSL